MAGKWGQECMKEFYTDNATRLKSKCVTLRTRRPSQINIFLLHKNFHMLNMFSTVVLKGQSHEKVGELRVWRGSLGPN
jgi:hypothetical protein